VDLAAGVLAENDIVELLGGVEAALGAEGELGGVALDAARGKVDVLRFERVEDVLRGDAVGGHLVGVEPEAHRVALLAEDADLADAGDRLHALLDEGVATLETSRMFWVSLCTARKMMGSRVGVGLLHDGRVGVLGQRLHHLRDLVADVVGGGFEVGVEIELDADGALALAGGGGNRADAGDAADGLLDGLGDLRVDDLGVRAACSWSAP
jgi:hypothetical protein